MELVIRLENKEDYFIVEEVTRKAFWNVHAPGCDEHYLAHIMRSHPDFCTDLDYVAEYKGEIIGNIMYTKSHLISENNEKKEIATFGPISVLPEFQRKGVGTVLIEHTKKIVETKGCPAIVIFGNPGNYVKHGFKSSKKYGIRMPNGAYPCSLLALALRPDAFLDRKWNFIESAVFDIDHAGFEQYDKKFPEMKKEYKPSQEEFDILSHSFIV